MSTSKRDSVVTAALDAIDTPAGCGVASATWVERILAGAGLKPNAGAIRAGLAVIDFAEAEAKPGDIAYLGGLDCTHGIVLEDTGNTLEIAAVDALGMVRLRRLSVGEVEEVRSIDSLL